MKIVDRKPVEISTTQEREKPDVILCKKRTIDIVDVISYRFWALFVRIPRYIYFFKVCVCFCIGKQICSLKDISILVME